jgi:hypothetical protein
VRRAKFKNRKHMKVAEGNTVKPALNGPFIKRKFVLNENIFRPRDFGSQKDVKYPGLNGNSLTRKRNQNKPLYRKFPVFRNASFRRILGILNILQNSVFSNVFIILRGFEMCGQVYFLFPS